MALLDPDRLFPLEAEVRKTARAIYESICELPLISPHGHCDPSWFAKNERFPNPAELFVVPDHYVFRMMVSQGLPMGAFGVPHADGRRDETDPRKIWQLFAEHLHYLRATPSLMWLEHSFQHVFGLDEPLNANTATAYYDHIEAKLSDEAFRPRALFDRFKIEVLATTEGALDDLKWHKSIRESGWSGKVVTTYRPDSVVDPEYEGFSKNLEQLGALTGEDVSHFKGYLAAHRARRAVFKSYGATASDHGHPTARTANLTLSESEALYAKIRSGKFTPDEADLFRGQMLTEMARMSLDDGLVLQIHPGSFRNHSPQIFNIFGRDKGFDIPTQTDYVHALKPLLDAFGLEPQLKIILFTLDETANGRELATLAGAYPALRLGPPWWFFDSAEGIRRWRETVTETCGFYNTVGFIDDTRAFCSIPARHDVSRRTDSAYLATLVHSGRLRKTEAFELAYDLSYRLGKDAYNF